MNRNDPSRTIHAPTGSALQAKSWLTEAPLRMLMNNLDPRVAEHPESLVVYGGIGRAARDWDCFDAIVSVLKRLEVSFSTFYLFVCFSFLFPSLPSFFVSFLSHSFTFLLSLPFSLVL